MRNLTSVAVIVSLGLLAVDSEATKTKRRVSYNDQVRNFISENVRIHRGVSLDTASIRFRQTRNTAAQYSMGKLLGQDVPKILHFVTVNKKGKRYAGKVQTLRFGKHHVVDYDGSLIQAKPISSYPEYKLPSSLRALLK